MLVIVENPDLRALSGGCPLLRLPLAEGIGGDCLAPGRIVQPPIQDRDLGRLDPYRLNRPVDGFL